MSTADYMEPENVSPSTVFGLTAYNGAAHLAEAIESLLTQTRGDLAVVVVDDASTDATAEIAHRYMELDPRVSYDRNDRQLGLARNWQRALELAAERFPDAPYFAWASDHDVWHPEWLERTAAELDGDDGAVLAYPDTVRIDDTGAEYPTSTQASAGSMIYGLGRRAAFERAGPFPRTVLPDRLFLIRLELEGGFRHVSRRLWYRRYRAGVQMTNARQRRFAFPDGVPLAARLPWWLHHAIVFDRPGRARLALGSALHSFRQGLARRQRQLRWWRRERRHQLAGALGRGSPAQPSSGEAPAEIDPRVLDELAAPAATTGVDVFAERPAELARELYEQGVPALYVVERESPELRDAVGRWYWLRGVWVEREGRTARKPDPATGLVPRETGSYRHLVGRRRLIPRG